MTKRVKLGATPSRERGLRDLIETVQLLRARCLALEARLGALEDMHVPDLSNHPGVTFNEIPTSR